MVAGADHPFFNALERTLDRGTKYLYSAFYLRHLLKRERAVPISSHMIENLDIFRCPGCGGNLEAAEGAIKCSACQKLYQTESGIPLLFLPNKCGTSKKDVTGKIKAFYEKTPFPNYEGLENAGDLVRKAERGVFSRLLNEQVPFNIRALEVGCGTGQSSNFLGIAQRYVFGTDMCLNSLKLAQQFKENNNLKNVGFYQMNLFRPIFKEESFHFVMCRGVLHHTGDPFGGFQSIAKLVKKGGYILIGLYNKYGRIGTDIRRIIFKASGNALAFLDPQLRGKGKGEVKKHAWFLDQYKNPHETKHTMGEVLGWFDAAGFDFVNSIPRLKGFRGFSENEKLFKTNPRGNGLDRFFVQAGLMLAGSREGGFFIMIGKRRH